MTQFKQTYPILMEKNSPELLSSTSQLPSLSGKTSPELLPPNSYLPSFRSLP